MDAAILVGIISALLVLFLLLLSRSFPRLNAALASIDSFSKNGVVGVGEPLRNAPRANGGAFTLLGGIAFATLTSVLALERSANNVNANRAIDVLGATQLAAIAGLPFASAPPWGAGLQIRVTASGEPGLCAAPLAWSFRGLDAGAWALASPAAAPPPPCGASAPTSAQLVFSCPACTLTAASSLDVTLHYSCQSLLLEVGALDANFTVTSLTLPPASTRGAPGALLSSVTWTLQPLVSVLSSSVASAASSRGYALSGSTFEAVHTPLASSSGGAALVAPLAASVRLRFALPLQPFFLNVVLTEKVPLSSLLTSIVGLAGIFSFFGTALGSMESVATLKRRVVVRRGAMAKVASSRPPSASGGAGDGEGPALRRENPLSVAAGEQLAAAAAAAGAAAPKPPAPFVPTSASSFGAADSVRRRQKTPSGCRPAGRATLMTNASGLCTSRARRCGSAPWRHPSRRAGHATRTRMATSFFQTAQQARRRRSGPRSRTSLAHLY